MLCGSISLIYFVCVFRGVQKETTMMTNESEGLQQWLLIEQEQPNLTDENRFFENPR